MNYLSVCSGIEAASVAWHPLGWKPVGFAEIEPFPSAVLAHHYPTVPNFGDMTRLHDLIEMGICDAPEILVGGTPCQAFSVAGLRKSLDDARGNLALVYCDLANAIDARRKGAGLPPAILVWENVPGVLSTKDNAFGCFLAGLAGEDDPLVPTGKRWPNAGYVLGPQRAVAWRILDAQYFGLAQRRRRVFVVASARDGFDPATVLFEWEGVRRDSAPRREQGKVAPTIPSRSTGGGGLGTDFDCDGGLIARAVSLRGREGGATAELGDDIQNCLRASGGGGDKPHVLAPLAFGGNNQSGPIEVATARNACASASGRMDFETETFLVQPAHTLRGEGFDASEDGTGRGTPLVPVNVCPTLRAGGNRTGGDRPPGTDVDTADSLIPVAFSCKDYGADAGEVAPTLRSMGHDKSHANAGGQVAIAFNARQDPDHWHDRTGQLGTDGSTQAISYAIQAGALRTNPASGPDGVGVQADHAYTLEARAEVQAVAVRDVAQTVTSNYGKQCDNSDTALGPNVAIHSMQVRRLTPTECARLQGFPDDYLDIPYRGKPAADGPKYKALGNSMAVPCMRWIGARIDAHIKGELPSPDEAFL